ILPRCARLEGAERTADLAQVRLLLSLSPPMWSRRSALWSWPSPRTLPRAGCIAIRSAIFFYFGRLIRAFAGTGFSTGTAWCVEGNFGAALWLPPEAEPDAVAVAVASILDGADRAT